MVTYCVFLTFIAFYGVLRRRAAARAGRGGVAHLTSPASLLGLKLYTVPGTCCLRRAKGGATKLAQPPWAATEV
eukprot:5033232-Prymnesium_polylepis.1